MITPKVILITALPFIGNIFLVYSIYEDLIPVESIKATIFMFYFPINIKFDLFRLILILLPILLIIGSFINSEIKERSIYLLLQMKSFRLWFQSLIVASFFTILLYFIVGYVITYVLVLFLPENIVINKSMIPFQFLYTTNEWTLITHQFFLLILSVLLLVLLNIFFTFLINHTAFASLLTIICLAASITIGNNFPSILNFLPLTYGLFAFRELNGYSFIWSYTFLILSILVLYIFTFGIFMIRKESLFKIQ